MSKVQHTVVYHYFKYDNSIPICDINGDHQLQPKK
jgi:hypothetical protein